MADTADRQAAEDARKARTRAAIVRLVDAAPPLSERQRAQLRLILGGRRDQDRPPRPDREGDDAA